MSYNYASIAVYSELGGALRLAKGVRAFTTDPTTGAPVDATQGTRIAPYVDADAAGDVSFTAESWPVRVTTGAVFEDVYPVEAPQAMRDAVVAAAASQAAAEAAAASATAPTDTTVATLALAAPTLYTNQHTNPRPAAGTTTGWGVSSGESIAAVTDGGEPCIEITDPTGTGNPTLYIGNSIVSPGVGRWMAVGVDVKPLSSAIAAIMRIYVRFQLGTTDVDTKTVTTPGTADVWGRQVMSFQQTSAAVDNLDILIWPNGSSGTPGAAFRARHVVVAHGNTQAEAEAAVATFFDGDTAASDGISRAWSGAANASTSKQYTRTSTRAALDRTLVGAAANGIVADGVTDAVAALRAAAATAVALGVPLLLPRGTIAVGSKVTLPANLTIITNEATILGLTATGENLLELGSDTRILGHLAVQVAAGTNVRGVAISGSRVRVDSLAVTAPSPGAGVGDNSDCALTVTGDDIAIGSAVVTNFDYPFKFSGADRIDVGYLAATSYVRGVYISDSTDLSIRRGLFKTASPNASVSPGHNGVLIDATAHDATRDIRLTDITVRDAGEHGFRIGGSKRVKRVWFTNPTAVNVGGCGIKILGGAEVDANYHEDIFITAPMIEDAGQTAGNAAGIMLQFVKRVKVTDLVVRKNLKTYSAAHGVEIQAAENVTVSNPTISDTLTGCYEVSFVLGDCTNIRLIGGLMSTATGDGIYINYTGRTFRRVSVEGHPQVDVSGTGFSLNVIATGGTVIGGSWLTWQSVQAAANQFGGTLSGWFCDTRAAFAGDPAFKNGSRWIDNATGVTRIRDAALWKTPTLV